MQDVRGSDTELCPHVSFHSTLVKLGNLAGSANEGIPGTMFLKELFQNGAFTQALCLQ